MSLRLQATIEEPYLGLGNAVFTMPLYGAFSVRGARFSPIFGGVPAMLVQVVYISSATKTFEPDELERLLESARQRNERNGVTGVLLHDDNSFLQVLEGTPEAVQHTLERIKRDPRHAGMTIVQDQPIAARDFSDWSMAYDRRDITEIDRMRGARKLEPGLLRAIAASLSQPVSRTFVQRFGERGRPTRATASLGQKRSAPANRST